MAQKYILIGNEDPNSDSKLYITLVNNEHIQMESKKTVLALDCCFLFILK